MHLLLQSPKLLFVHNQMLGICSRDEHYTVVSKPYYFSLACCCSLSLSVYSSHCCSRWLLRMSLLWTRFAETTVTELHLVLFNSFTHLIVFGKWNPNNNLNAGRLFSQMSTLGEDWHFLLCVCVCVCFVLQRTCHIWLYQKVMHSLSGLTKHIRHVTLGWTVVILFSKIFIREHHTFQCMSKHFPLPELESLSLS